MWRKLSIVRKLHLHHLPPLSLPSSAYSSKAPSPSSVTIIRLSLSLDGKKLISCIPSPSCITSLQRLPLCCADFFFFFLLLLHSQPFSFNSIPLSFSRNKNFPSRVSQEIPLQMWDERVKKRSRRWKGKIKDSLLIKNKGSCLHSFCISRIKTVWWRSVLCGR